MRIYIIFLLFGLCLIGRALPAQQVEDFGLDLDQLEERLLEWVNQERSARGLPELDADASLREVARAHSRKMMQEKKLSHTFPDYDPLTVRLADAGVYFFQVGENVACSDTFIMRIVHQALMDSPGHRNNILSTQFGQLGIGIAFDGQQYYTTQVFARTFTPIPAQEVEQELVAMLKNLSIPGWREPLGKSPELQALCRQRAGEFLYGDTDPKLPETWTWGRAELVTHSFSEFGQVSGKLARELASRPSAWILGAAFQRSDVNPGGCYAVTLVKFPDLMLDGNAQSRLFSHLNRLRRDAGLPQTVWLNSLAAYAKNTAISFLNRIKNRTIKGEFKTILAYETADIDSIPHDILESITRKGLKSLGLHVLYPTESLPYRNVLIVAIAAR